MAHLWSGRFEGGPDAALFAFGASFRFDRRLFEDDVTGSVAWAEAIHAAGVLSAAEVAAIKGALDEILAAGSDPAFFDADAAKDDEDVHSFVERELVARVGEAGRRLHTGRSRNEQVSLDLRLYLKRRVPLLQKAIEALIQVLGDQAVAAGDAVMPSYTHLRRAQPVLVAHFFLAHTAALRRDHGRLTRLLDEIDELPLGSGAIAGTSYGIDVPALAARLGFSRIVLNSIDATGDRDFVSSFLHAAALAMVHISRIAEDFILFTSEEFRFFELADTAATGSSLMPQKKNPDPLELVRGKSGRVIGRLAGWLATMKSLPIGYSKDLQEDKEAVFEAEDTLRGSIDAAATVVAGLTLNRERHGDGGVRAPARDRCGRLPGRQGRALPRRARDRRGAGPAAGAGEPILRSDDRWTNGGRIRRCSMRTCATSSRRRHRWPASARRSRPSRTRSRRRSASCARGWKLRVSREKAEGKREN